MSYNEKVTEEIIEYKGSIVKVLKTSRGLYLCPLCKKALFYTNKDIILHIIAHAKGIVDKRKPPPQRWR